jgi:hypothetical protein
VALALGGGGVPTHSIARADTRQQPPSTCSCLRKSQSGSALAPLTSTLEKSANLAPWRSAKRLISALLPGSWAPNCARAGGEPFS